jgi:hypothetical protein
MEIFSHFCDVFIQYYKIVILQFYYHTFNIALGGILYQKLPKSFQRTIFLKHSSKPTPISATTNNLNQLFKHCLGKVIVENQ